MDDRIYVPAGEDIVEIELVDKLRRNIASVLGLPAHLLEYVPVELNRQLIEQEVEKVNKFIRELDEAIKNW